jgi:hypothetical protein
MCVVWRGTAKSLEYGIWRGEAYQRAAVISTAGQPHDLKYVSEGAIEIHIRVIVFTVGFATITTVLEVNFAPIRTVSVRNY